MCVCDSRWEGEVANLLDMSKIVQSWVKNDHLGFEVLLTFGGVVRKFRPDFLIRLVNGVTLVLEIKGQDDDQNRMRREYLAEWVRAVNAHGDFGKWASDVALSTDSIRDHIERHSRD